MAVGCLAQLMAHTAVGCLVQLMAHTAAAGWRVTGVWSKQAAEARRNSGKSIEEQSLLAAPTPEQIKKAKRAYYGAVSYVDDCIGKLLDTVKQCGLDDNTIVIFSGDDDAAFQVYDLLLPDMIFCRGAEREGGMCMPWQPRTRRHLQPPAQQQQETGLNAITDMRTPPCALLPPG
ncbi:hypothetical protein LTR85_003919 [Meristemomyces frigidus]|nr:hypothetical protein LTR85_003919 [Meristemomyces frigidus]